MLLRCILPPATASGPSAMFIYKVQEND
jgi:hypothetical protein